MKVLITGAFGNLGLMCVEEALALGYEVRCFDLDNAANRKKAAAYSSRVEVFFGDLRDAQLQERIVHGVDAIIHNASVLPPVTENAPELAQQINVVACQQLIEAALRSPLKPVFVFPSSVTVFGLPIHGESPRTAQDAVQATDNYTRHKLAIESYLKTSALPWVIVRVGVSVDTRTLATDRKTFRQLLDVHPDNPFEYVHPKDVAHAMCRAATSLEACGKILLLGGGASCQVRQRDFINTAFVALGIPLPLQVHGQTPFYTHWMDTSESQRILQFQRHTFADYQQEMAAKLKPIRYLLFPLRWIVQAILPFILKHL